MPEFRARGTVREGYAWWGLIVGVLIADADAYQTISAHLPDEYFRN